MEPLWSTILGFYGALVCAYLAVASFAFPGNQASPRVPVARLPNWVMGLAKLCGSSSLIAIGYLLLANTGFGKERTTLERRYRDLCLTATVDVRNVGTGGGGVFEANRGVWSFKKGYAPVAGDLQCDVRSGSIPFLVRPATDSELNNDSRPFRKITYLPARTSDGSCHDPLQKQIVESLANNPARYSVVRRASSLISRDDVKLGIKGDEVRVSDEQSGEVLVVIRYFYIRNEFRVCPNIEDSLPVHSLVREALGLSSKSSKLLDHWRR